MSNEGKKSELHDEKPQVQAVSRNVSNDSSRTSQTSLSLQSSEVASESLTDTLKAENGLPERPEYQWPPQKDPDLSYRAKSRNPVHSIITALPVIMMVTGLYFYFKGEAQQTQSMPIRSESVDISGIFTGLSQTSGRHYLWLDVEGVAKGVRIKSDQLDALVSLVRDAQIDIKMAPTVHESRTFWVWHVEQSGKVFMDAAETLR